MRFVLDTDVVVAAMRSPTGASAAILRAARESRIVLLMNVALAMEYESVCRRTEHTRAAGFADPEVDGFVDALIGMAHPVEIHFLWRPQLSDPEDEMVLDVAINGRAEAIVTFNARDFGDAPRLFGIDMLLPRIALTRIRQ